MSLAELIHRLQEMAKRKCDRIFPQRHIGLKKDHGPLPVLPGLREGLRQWEVPPPLIAQWEEHAEQLKTGRYFLLGQQWPCPVSGSIWHLDPVTLAAWPASRYCFEINFRHNARMGDIKYVWELNRLQHVQPVAALAYIRQDTLLASLCLQQIESWIHANPPFKGVNWASGIELGLRLVSILTVVTLLHEHMTNEQRMLIWHTLETHANWLARYPSKFSSANNHLTAEGLGLFLTGTLCPAFHQAQRWKAHGWELLCQTARLQILPDGVGAEQTPNYTAVVLEMLLLGLHVASDQSMTIPDDYSQRLLLAGEYLRWFTDDRGQQPRIGDDDNARVLGMYRPDETYVRSILGCIAAVFHRPELTPPHLEVHLRNAIFGIPPAPGPAPQGRHIFHHGGYTAGHHQMQQRSLMLIMDHGYLGYLSIAAHGHADALSLWLHIDGQPVLIDAGTYLYHSGGTWRNHFRGTAAHNTLCLEHTDSSLMAGHFNWSHKAHASLIRTESTANQWIVEAAHDGYRKQFGITHHRRITMDLNSGFTVDDWLSGTGSHAVEISYLIHPALSVLQQEGGIIIYKETEALLSIHPPPSLLLGVHGGDSAACGWYSPGFGVKEPAPRIVFSGILQPMQTATTRFMVLPPRG